MTPIPAARRFGVTFLLLPTLALASGCGASKKKLLAQEEEITALKRQIAVVQRDQADQRAQAEQVRNQLFILHDRLETTETRLSRTTQAPPKLEVVKLVPQNADPLTARVKTVRPMPQPDPLDDASYDPSADEAEMFSYADDDAAAARASDIEESERAGDLGRADRSRIVRLEAPVAPAKKPVRVAAASLTTLPDALADTSTARPKEDPMAMYQRAFTLFQAKNWNDAMLSFEDFVRANPTHEYADNAYYWMGECFYGQTEFALAIGEFQKVAEMYPGGNKVPDALLKIGMSYVSLNNSKSAEKTFRQLVDAYPQSEAAGLAKQKLQKIQP